MAIQVDLRAPTVSTDQRIWRMFPGRGYQFLTSFLEEGVGFLDFPDLTIPDNLGPKSNLIPEIARSQDIREAFFKYGPSFKPESIKLRDYGRARRTQKRSRLEQAFLTLALEAKAGDYVVLPEPVYRASVRVGQIASNKSAIGHYPYRYGPTPIPAREIVWRAVVPENSISVTLSNSLRHQHPFTLLEKSLYVEVLSLVHGSFVYGDRHAATVYNTQNDFLDSDAALLGAISRLASAAAVAVDAGKTGLGDLLDVLLRTPPIDYTCSQAADIHSPGFNRYVSGSIVSLVIAAVAAGLIGLSEYSSKQSLANDIKSLVVMNTAPGADPLCTARVSQASAMVMSAFDTDRTWALCQAARDAAKRAGLKSSATPSKR